MGSQISFGIINETCALLLNSVFWLSSVHLSLSTVDSELNSRIFDNLIIPGLGDEWPPIITTPFGEGTIVDKLIGIGKSGPKI